MMSEAVLRTKKTSMNTAVQKSVQLLVVLLLTRVYISGQSGMTHQVPGMIYAGIVAFIGCFSSLKSKRGLRSFFVFSF